MIFRGRTISTEADLQWFVKTRVQEAIDIEYKSESYGGNDESRREFLRDVTSFANAQGGLILIGIGEDGEGIATSIPGVEKGNHSETITSACLANVENKIMGLNCEEIELSGNRVVVALPIPRSLNAPHMVTFKGLNQFWRRHGRQKNPMSVGEIMDVMDNRLRGRNRIEEFDIQRDKEIHSLIGEAAWLSVHCSPIYSDPEVIDVTKDDVEHLIGNTKSRFDLYNDVDSVGSAIYTLDGLRFDEHIQHVNDGQVNGQYLELHRNGYLEYGADVAASRYSLPSTIVGYTVHAFVDLASRIYQLCGVSGPYATWLRLHNLNGHHLGVDSPSQRVTVDASRINKSKFGELVMTKFQASDLSIEGLQVGRQINDRLWNAFGFDRAHLYDSDGKLLR